MHVRDFPLPTSRCTALRTSLLKCAMCLGTDCVRDKVYRYLTSFLNVSDVSFTPTDLKIRTRILQCIWCTYLMICTHNRTNICSQSPPPPPKFPCLPLPAHTSSPYNTPRQHLPHFLLSSPSIPDSPLPLLIPKLTGTMSPCHVRMLASSTLMFLNIFNLLLRRSSSSCNERRGKEALWTRNPSHGSPNKCTRHQHAHGALPLNGDPRSWWPLIFHLLRRTERQARFKTSQRHPARSKRAADAAFSSP